jgi:hypothetical protein
MNRSIAIVGAPTSIGIGPYDSGEPKQLDRALEFSPILVCSLDGRAA